jgi:hypothetical protein
VLLHRTTQVEVHHAGLDHGQPVVRVDLDDLVHPGGDQHDAPVDGVGRTREAAAGTPRHDRHAGGRTRADHGLHLSGVHRKDYGERLTVRGQRHHVAPIAARDVGIHQHRGVSDGFAKLGEQTFVSTHHVTVTTSRVHLESPEQHSSSSSMIYSSC